MNTASADEVRKTPEQYIQESLGLVQAASINNQYLQVSQKYSYPPGETAVVLCYVTCPQAMAKELRQAVDAAVLRVFAEQGLIFRKPQ